MVNLNQNKYKRSLSTRKHVLFWFSILLFFTFIQLVNEGNDKGFVLILGQNLKHMPAMIFAAYLFNELTIPLVLRKKKYLLFLILSVVIIYIASAFDRIVNIYIYEALFRKEPYEQESFLEILTSIDSLFSGYIPYVFIATAALSLYMLIIERNRYELQNLKLERDKNKAELEALKAQIHPHFLFNTLNNLYALTVQKSNSAPKMVESLSSILDYILYKCNDKYVSLSSEINLIKNYIELERLRFDESLKIDFSIDIDRGKEETIQIAPLILLTIIENAFKHGLSNHVEELEIQIHLSVIGGEILFYVKNSKSSERTDNELSNRSGIGITNIKQQLEQLYTDWDFHRKDSGKWYYVDLRINTLSAHV